MGSRVRHRLQTLALLTLVLTAQSNASEPPKETTSIGGVRIGATKEELAHLGTPIVRRTGDAADPEWRFNNGLVVLFWAGEDEVVHVESRARSVCTDTGVCPGMSAAHLNQLLGPDVMGQYPVDGEHEYATTYDTCWLNVAVSDGVVRSIALVCQP